MTLPALQQQNLILPNLGSQAKQPSGFSTLISSLPTPIEVGKKPDQSQADYNDARNEWPNHLAIPTGFAVGIKRYAGDVWNLPGNILNSVGSAIGGTFNAISHPQKLMSDIGNAFQSATKHPDIMKVLTGFANFVGKLTGGPFLDSAQAFRNNKPFYGSIIATKHVIDIGLMIYGPGLLKNFAQKLPLLIKAIQSGKYNKILQAAKTKRPSLAVRHGKIAIAEKKAKAAGIIVGAANVATQSESVATTTHARNGSTATPASNVEPVPSAIPEKLSLSDNLRLRKGLLPTEWKWNGLNRSDRLKIVNTIVTKNGKPCFIESFMNTIAEKNNVTPQFLQMLKEQGIREPFKVGWNLGPSLEESLDIILVDFNRTMPTIDKIFASEPNLIKKGITKTEVFATAHQIKVPPQEAIQILANSDPMKLARKVSLSSSEADILKNALHMYSPPSSIGKRIINFMLRGDHQTTKRFLNSLPPNNYNSLHVMDFMDAHRF